MDSTTNIRADGDYDNILHCKVKLNDLKLNDVSAGHNTCVYQASTSRALIRRCKSELLVGTSALLPRALQFRLK